MTSKRSASPQGDQLNEAVIDAATPSGEQARLARDTITQALHNPEVRTLIDLSGLRVIGSSVLAVLIAAADVGAESIVALVLSREVADALEAWRIDPGWPVFSNVLDARLFLEGGAR